MSTAAPERTVVQRMEALGRANEIRTKRATWKLNVKHGQVDPLGVLLEPPPEFMSMKIVDVLLAMPKVGRTKANVFLRQVGVSPTRTLAGLTVRQRGELVSLAATMRRR
jgi:hypothetical protein